MTNAAGPFHRWRRQLLAAGGLLALAALYKRWWDGRHDRRPPEASSQNTLQAWVDLLLPADGDAPGAVALGVDRLIADAARRNATLGALMSAGIAWVDEQARRRGGASFAALDQAAREAIVTQAQSSAPGSTPRVFFQSTLDDTLYHHYGDARSWPALGFERPPQPLGYPDHVEPLR
jgi:hypothetical protein